MKWLRQLRRRFLDKRIIKGYTSSLNYHHREGTDVEWIDGKHDIAHSITICDDPVNPSFNEAIRLREQLNQLVHYWVPRSIIEREDYFMVDINPNKFPASEEYIESYIGLYRRDAEQLMTYLNGLFTHLSKRYDIPWIYWQDLEEFCDFLNSPLKLINFNHNWFKWVYGKVQTRYRLNTLKSVRAHQNEWYVCKFALDSLIISYRLRINKTIGLEFLFTLLALPDEVFCEDFNKSSELNRYLDNHSEFFQQYPYHRSVLNRRNIMDFYHYGKLIFNRS